jgi:uncharacterized membrane protein YedE/YeeE
MATDLSSVVVGGGLVLGLVFGAVAQKSNFCTMGALSDIVNMGHWGRMRMWMLAVAVGVLGTAALAWAGLVDIGQAVVMRPTLPWLSLLVGGGLFGVGMTLTGGCPSRNLVRLGSGSLRSFVVLVFVGITGYMTLKGLFGAFRATALDPVALSLGERGWPDQGLPTALARGLGLAPSLALAVAVAAVAVPLLAFALRDARFRANRWQLIGGLVIGAVIVGGWLVSGHLGFGENPETLEDSYFATNSRTLESLSFIAPLAFGLELLLRWTDQSLHLSFGIAALIGVVAGAAAVALATGRFRWEGFASLSDLRQQLAGAALMGFGGVTALGCTVGQGLSGMSTMALGSFIATGAIIAGCVGTLKLVAWREERSVG